MFNKDNIELVTPVKQGHIPKFSKDSLLKFQPCEMLEKQLLKPL